MIRTRVQQLEANANPIFFVIYSATQYTWTFIDRILRMNSFCSFTCFPRFPNAGLSSERCFLSFLGFHAGSFFLFWFPPLHFFLLILATMSFEYHASFKDSRYVNFFWQKFLKARSIYEFNSICCNYSLQFAKDSISILALSWPYSNSLWRITLNPCGYKTSFSNPASSKDPFVFSILHLLHASMRINLVQPANCQSGLFQPTQTSSNLL